MIVVVFVNANPVVVVTGAAQRLHVDAPYVFETHANSGGMKMRFKRSDSGGRIQHFVGIEPLTGFIGADVDIDAVAQPPPCIPEMRRITFGEKLKPVQQAGFHVASVGVNVGGIENHAGIRLQQFARVVGKNIGVAAHFMYRPAAAAFAGWHHEGLFTGCGG